MLSSCHCVEAYREIHFKPKCYQVGGTLGGSTTVHRVTGLLVEGDSVQYSGIMNKDSLVVEIEGLLDQAFKLSMEGAFVKEEMMMNGNNVDSRNGNSVDDDSVDDDGVEEGGK